MENKELLQRELLELTNQDGSAVIFELDHIHEQLERTSDIYSNVFIKVVSFLGGILSCLFFSGFLALAGLFNSEAGLIIIGILSIVASVLMNKHAYAVFLQSLSVAVFVMGYVLLGIGIVESSDGSMLTLYVSYIIVSLLVLFLLDNYLLLFITIMVMNVSLLLWAASTDIRLLTVFFLYTISLLLMLYLGEAKLLTNRTINILVAPARLSYAVTLLILFGVSIELVYNEGTYYAYIPWINTLIIAIALLYSLYSITKFLELPVVVKAILAGVVLLFLIPSYYAPGIGVSVLILLLSYHIMYKPVIVLSIISMIHFICSYYYQLNQTLLVKSIMMLGVGVLFIVSYLLLKKTIE